MEQFSDVKKRETLEALSINGPQNGFYRKADGSVPNTHIVKMKELFANECIADETSFDMVNMTPNEQKRFELTPDTCPAIGRYENARCLEKVAGTSYPIC